jgi:broad specificity phosphatase PhoE
MIAVAGRVWSQELRLRAVTFDRAYLFARHARAIYQTPTFGAETFPRGTDWPLSDVGESQARELGRALARAGCERIVSSALLRARRTAELAYLESGIPYDDAWPELNEISPRTLRQRPVPWKRPQWWEGIVGAWHLRRHLHGVASETRDVATVERRIRDVLARLDAMPEKRIAIISHGYFIFLLAVLVPGRARPRPMRNCSITRVQADGEGRYRLAAFAKNAIRAHR